MAGTLSIEHVNSKGLITNRRPRQRSESLPLSAHHDDVGTFDGTFQQNRYHPEYYEAALRFFREYGEDSFSPGEFKRGSLEQKV